jgi:NitT/TauT family transport system substrate-binding protein
MNYNNFIVVFGAYIMFLLSSCGNSNAVDNNDKTTADDKDTLALKIAVMPTLDCLPFFIAKEQGIFEKEGLKVSLKMFNAQMDCDTALTSGFVDGAFTDLVRVEHLNKEGLGCMARTSTSASWQLLSNKNAKITNLTQLEDKMIASTRFSATHMLADIIMNEAGYSDDKTFLVQINDVNIRLMMLRNNEMDAVLLPEPYATLARMDNHNVLKDSRQMGLQLGALAFRTSEDSIKNQNIDKLLVIYEQICDKIDESGLTSYRNLISEYCNIKEPLVDSIPLDIKFSVKPNVLRDNQTKAKSWYNDN